MNNLKRYSVALWLGMWSILQPISFVIGLGGTQGDLQGWQQILGVTWAELPAYRQVFLCIAGVMGSVPWLILLYLWTRPSYLTRLTAVSVKDARLWAHVQRISEQGLRLVQRRRYAEFELLCQRQLTTEIPQMLERLFGKKERERFTQAMTEVQNHTTHPVQVFNSMKRYLMDLFASRGEALAVAAAKEA